MDRSQWGRLVPGKYVLWGGATHRVLSSPDTGGMVALEEVGSERRVHASELAESGHRSGPLELVPPDERAREEIEQVIAVVWRSAQRAAGRTYEQVDAMPEESLQEAVRRIAAALSGL